MSILVQCPNPDCKASSMVEDSISGRNVKCKRCGKSFVAKPTMDAHKGDTKKEKAASNTNPFPVLPAEFGRYRILRQLGRGGMGAVYLAQDTQLGRQVALKVPFFDAAESPQRAERFVREARSAAVLQHPNICTVFDAGQIDGRPFITMAYIAGTPLEKEIDPELPMAQVPAAEIVSKIALALQHAHQTGIVHRDLKPANVMMAAGGEPVVMDFGLAKRVADADPNEAKLTREGGLLGTPSYMAPEQVKGDAAAVGPATDVYALGVILFEMLTGRTPFSGGITVVIGQILAAPAPAVKEFRRDVDLRLEAICCKAMAKEPAERFASMAELADALGQYLKASSAPPPVAAVVKAPPPATAVRTAFDDLEIVPLPVTALKKVKPNRILTALSVKFGRKRMLLMLAVALVALLALFWWLAGSVLRVETANGTLVVEMNDAETEARIKKGKLILTGPDDKVRYVLAPSERNKKIEAGSYKIQVEGADGLSLDTSEFTLKKGDKVTVRVTAAPKATPAANASELQAAPTASDPDREAAEYALSLGGMVRVNDQDRDLKAISDLPREPFRLTGLTLKESHANDAALAPFRSCKNLSYLDLSWMDLTGAGLTNFKDCKHLKILSLACSPKITDAGFGNFKDCKELRWLDLDGTQVGDGGLASFKDCKNLDTAGLNFTRVTDAGLAQFKDNRRLVSINLQRTQVGNVGLAYLSGCTRLMYMDISHTHISDLSPLTGKPLRVLSCDFQAERDTDVLRSIPTLETINGKPAAEFWKEIDPNQAKVAAATNPPAEDNNSDFTNSIGMKLKLIRPGTFLMGSPKGAEPAADNEQPQHEVEITKPFYMGVYPVTKGQFAAFVKDSGYQTEAEKNGGALGFQLATAKWESKPEYNWRNPGFPQADDHPVVGVTWNDATAFCAWLSKKEGKDYVLPTEGEWEYACRAGTTTRYWCGDTDASLQGNANLADLSLKQECPAVEYAAPWNDKNPFTSQVGAFKPNSWGLYDMAGNVWQWCSDGYDKYADNRIKDPQGATDAKERVLRGGSWNDGYQLCQSAFRLHLVPTYRTSDLGFRVALRQTGATASVSPIEPSPGVDPDKKEADDKGWVSLFNGKDLKGWKIHPSQPGNWRVVKGMLTASANEFTHLYTNQADYRDFHLRLEVRSSANGFSGVNLRAPFGPVVPSDVSKPVSRSNAPVQGGGYRALISCFQIGGLFIDTDPVARHTHIPQYRPDEWNTYEVIAEGNNIVIKVNGETTCDYTDEQHRHAKGHIVLAAWGGAVVEFRKIEIKKLTSAKTTPPAEKSVTGPPADAFQTKSVWVSNDQKMNLKVLERKGEKFTALFVVGDNLVREVSGTVKDGRLSWLAKDVKALKGGAGGDNQATITSDKDGDLLDFTWRAPSSDASGAFVLRLKTGK